MAYQLIFKKSYLNKVAKLLNYLQKEWNQEVTNDFINKLDRRLSKLKEQPYLGRQSSKYKSVRSILITKHNKLYYRIEKDTIVILNLYDARSNPKKNRYL